MAGHSVDIVLIAISHGPPCSRNLRMLFGSSRFCGVTYAVVRFPWKRTTSSVEKEADMITNYFARMRPCLMSLGLIAFAAIGIAGSPASAQSSKHRKDARTCASFGSQYGTRAFSDCMLDQQRRRDIKERETLEKMALTSQIAREGQIMAERARQQRCDRNPDRRECRR